MAISEIAVSKIKNILAKIKLASLNKIERITFEKNISLSLQIKATLNLYHKKGGLKPDLRMLKLIELYDYLLKYKPKTILEFGEGRTSSNLAKYQKQYNCYVFQIDENLKFAKTFNEISKIDSKLVIAERIFTFENDTKNNSYDVKIIRHFDLAVMDGPDLTVNGKKHTAAGFSDVINQVGAGFKPNIILVGGRDATAFRLSAINKDKLFHTSIRKIRFNSKKFYYWNTLVPIISQNAEKNQKNWS